MSFSLDKVVLKNIRSHGDYTFEPLKTGVTAISGPNGSGKSTIVDSITWALYGTKPQGVSRAKHLAKNGTELGKESCYVQVFFTLDGNRCMVERKIVNKNGAVECSWFDLSTDDEGNEVADLKAGPAVSHAEPYVIKRLGMAETHFLSSVLVQQKQVDQLITSGPKERTQVIERMTGIDSITKALTDARQELNGLKKLATHLPDKAGEIDDMEAELKEDVSKLSSMKESGQKSVALVKTLSSEAKTLKDDVVGYRKQWYRKRTLLTRSELAKTQLYEVTGSVNELEHERASLKDELKGVQDLGSFKDITARLKDKERELKDLQMSVGQLNEKLSKAKREHKECSDIVASHDESYAVSAAEELSKNASLVKELEDLIETTKSEVSSLQSDLKKIDKAEKTLTKEGGHCPTCLQSVSDVTAVIDVFDKDRERINSEIKLATSLIKDSQTKLSSLKESVAELEKYLKASEDLETLSDEVKSLSKELNSLESQSHVTSKEIDEIRKTHSKLTALKAKKEQLDDVKAKLVAKLERKNNIVGDIEAFKEELKELDKFSETGLEALESKYSRVEQKLSDAKQKSTEIKAEYTILREKAQRVREDIKAAKKAKEDYENVLRDIESTANSVEVIEEFKAYRIEYSIPVIKRYASEFLNRFTDGMFTGVELDSKFNVEVVLSDGTKRAVGLLSGGELSAAALALRLAIAMVGSGSSGGSIILDEVLVSQDTLRAETILSVISEVCQGQVVIIAHNDTIDSVADKVVSLASEVS